MRQAFGDYEDRADDFELIGDERGDEDDAPPADRRLPTIALTMLVMALFAGGLWFAYHRTAPRPSLGGAGVPLIRADRTPDKVKPAEPGGMKIPDQNVSLYNEKPGISPIEKLLPPPEKPLPLPQPPPPPPRQAVAAPSPAMIAPPPAATMAPPPAAEPRPAIDPREAAPPAIEPREAAPPAIEPREAVPPAASHPPGFGRIEVRLASVRTPDEARAEWDRLKRENPELLGRLHAFAVRSAEGGQGIFYGVEAGPFADVAAAEHLCSELRRRGRGCVVAR